MESWSDTESQVLTLGSRDFRKTPVAAIPQSTLRLTARDTPSRAAMAMGVKVPATTR